MSVFRHETFVDLLCARAEGQRSRPALTYLVDGDEIESSLSYGDLDRRARAIAAAMAADGIAPGERALLLYPPGLDYITAFLSCLYAGVVAVPAYPPDLRRLQRTLPRLRSLIQDSGATVALAEPAIKGLLEAGNALPAEIPAHRWLSTSTLAAAGGHLAWQRPPIDRSSLALLQYTSGSTGAPKGVMLSHDNLLSNSAFIQTTFAVHDESVVIIWLPPYHDMGLIGGILQPLYAGCPAVLMSPLDFLARPIRWLRAITRHRGTVSGGPNFAYDLCARKISEEDRATLDLSTWSVAFNGAEPIRPATLARFSEAFADQGFRPAAFHPCYGLAEATLIVTGRAGAARKEVSRGQALVGSGHAIAGEQIVIADADRSGALRDGELGEIWVAGPHVAQGYWAKPELTELTFGARLADGRGPFLRTGDLGFLADGELFVAGRIKDLIIVRGRNLYPQDLELSVEQSHRAIRPGCVAALASGDDDEERVAIVAEVDPRVAADADEILAAARRALVDEHEIAPGVIALVRAGAIPKTSSGKLQRSACGDAWRGGQLEVIAEWRPARSVAHDDAEWPALRLALDETEAWLLERIAALSGQWPPQTLDRAAPIASYLDSLQSLELQHAIESHTGRTLPFAQLGGAHVGELAAALRAGSPATEPAPPAADDAAGAPLSHGQRALWMMERLAPDTGIYSIAGAARIHGPLDAAALERAMTRLVARQAALRSVVELAGDEPRLRIADPAPVAVESIDSEGEPSQRELTDEANRSFPEGGPLFRLQLWRSRGGGRVLLLVLHHLIADLWSVSVLMHELEQLYVDETGGPAAALAPLPTSHAAHVRAQTSALDGPRGAALRAHWQRQLAPAVDPVELPIDGVRPRERSFRGASVAFDLDPALARDLRRLAAAEGATLYVAMLAAFFALLHRYTGQSDLIIGSPTTGRARSSVRDVVGYFVNMVPIRGDLSGSPSFRELVNRLRATTAATLDHADLPFPLLVEWLAPPRDPSRPLLVQVSFAFHKSQLGQHEGLAGFALRRDGARLPFGPLTFESIALETRAMPFELELHIADRDGGLIGRLDYNTDLMTRGAVERMVGHLSTLLRHAVAAPDRRVAEIPIVAGAELAALVAAQEPGAWLGRSVVELFAERVRERPAAVALTQDGLHLTYGDLDARANRLAHLLRADGIGREQIVAVSLPRSFEMVIALLGIAKTGAAYVCLDQDYPDERLAFMLADSRPRLVLARPANRARFAAAGARCLCLDEQADALARQPATAPGVTCFAEDLFYVMYTSGSTGNPKGILVHNESVVGAILADGPLPFADGLVTLAHSPMSWDVPIHEIWGALLGGGRCVLYPSDTAMEIDRLAELARREGVSALLLTPALFHTVLDVAPGALAPVKHLLVGGDAVSVSHMRRGAAALPNTRIVHGYGPAECTMVSTCHVLSAPPPPDAPVVPIGVDCADKVTYVLDGRLQLVPLGVVGEIYIGGPSVARGYVNNPGFTAERFLPDFLSGRPGARMYRTGDFARRRADGELEFAGRSDQQVKVRGVRIELSEIERALEALPAVRDAAVVLHGALGAERSLIGYVVLHEPPSFDAAVIRRELAKRLPAVMVPSHVVALDAMPLTPNAKVDRRALAALPLAKRSADDAAATTTDTEHQLAGIWCSLLDLARVGPSTNFFEEGGNSLLLARMSVQIRETFHVDLPLAVIFQSANLAELALAVDERKGQSKRRLPPLARASREGIMLDPKKTT